MNKKLKVAVILLASALMLMILVIPYVQAWNNTWTDDIAKSAFVDDFNDGNYNEWTVISGQWSVMDGVLKGQNNGIIKTNANYPFIRFVMAKMRTEQVGYAPYTTATLMINYKDSQNMVLLRLFSTQILELIVIQGGAQVWGKQVPCAKSVYDWHFFKADIRNEEIFISVDTTLYMHETNSYFNNLQNSVGFHTCGDGTIADYDDVYIDYHSKGSEWTALSGSWDVAVLEGTTRGFNSSGTGMILANNGKADWEGTTARYIEVRMRTVYHNGGNTYDVATIVADYVSANSMILVRLFHDSTLEWLCISPGGNYGFQTQIWLWPADWHTFIVQADPLGAGYARWRIWIDGFLYFDKTYRDIQETIGMPAPRGYAGIHNCNNPQIQVDYVTLQWS
jgi:hypothetical protein